MKKQFTLIVAFVFISQFATGQISFGTGSTIGCAPLNVNFYNYSSGAAHYMWSFGDGNNSGDVYDTTYVFVNPGTYTVTLYGYDPGYSLIGSATTTINVGGALNGIGMNQSTVCPLDGASFYCYNTTSPSYDWDFGDGTFATTNNYYAEHQYANPGSYNVSVSYQSCGYSTSYAVINVDASLPYFGGNPAIWVYETTLCPGAETSAGVNGGPYQIYNWDFGNGNGAASESVDLNYAGLGAYTLSVNLTNGCGVDTTLYESIVVNNLSPAPVLPISGPSEVCIGGEFNVMLNSYPPNLNFVWDFGDGTSPLNTTNSYAYHTYNSAGTYIIELTVENFCGNTSTSYFTIDATTTAPISNPYFNLFPSIVCPGDLVNFSTNNYYDYYIDFGDGTGLAGGNNHSYNQPGTYPVSVTLQNTCGSTFTIYDTVQVQLGLPFNGTPNMNVNPDPACPNADVQFSASYGYSSYAWDFGDGYTSSYLEVDHPYLNTGTYPVSVTISNGCGASLTLNDMVVIAPNIPVDYLVWAVYSTEACVGSSVYASEDGDNELDIVWDFGDGSTSTDNLASHVYDTPGNYVITLTAENSCGSDTTVSHNITIGNGILPDLSAIEVEVQSPGCIGDNLYFAIVPAGMGSYSWDFGDGNFGVSDLLLYVQAQPFQVGFHSYTMTGTYNATLTITNTCGNSVDTTVAITIGGFGAGVPADISFWLNESETICEGQPVTFFSIGASTYIWNFGDGTGNLITNTSLIPVEHIYDDFGVYTVTVTGLNACGGEETQSENIFIPDSKIDVVTNTVTDSDCGENNGIAIVSASGGTQPYSYSWTNGDESVFADSLGSGIYVVTVTDNNGCSTEAIAAVSDDQGPVILLETIVHNECYGENNGVVSVSVLGGAPPYDIMWSNGEGTEAIYGLEAGPYEIFVTDANGCFSSSSYTIEQPQNSIVSVYTQPATCGSNDGGAVAVIVDGVMPYNFIWPNTTGSSDQTSGLAPGVYEVFIIDGNTCLLSKNFVINETNGPNIVTDSITDASCSGDLSAVYISTIGGTAPFDYSWSNGSTSEDLSNVLPGEYSVEVEGSDGCSSFMFYNLEMSAPEETSICIVTVDTLTNSNIVVWVPVMNPDVVSYNIYKESSQSGLYYLVANQSSDSISEYYDYSSNPAIRSWRYKVAAVDDCGNEAELSDPHKTMHLTSNLGVGGVVNLIWDHYNGFDYNTYYINRYHPSTGWMVIDSVGSLNISYTDLTPPNDSNLVYIIDIFPPNICTASKAKDHNSSRSNKSGINAPDLFGSGINETDEVDFSIYPNPTSGMVQILYSSLISEVKVFDLSGQLVYQTSNSTNTLSIDFADFANGIYMVQFSTINGPIYSKIVKQ